MLNDYHKNNISIGCNIYYIDIDTRKIPDEIYNFFPSLGAIYVCPNIIHYCRSGNEKYNYNMTRLITIIIDQRDSFNTIL